MLQTTLNHASCSDFRTKAIRLVQGTVSLVIMFASSFFQDPPNDGLHQAKPGGDQSSRGAWSQPAAEEQGWLELLPYREPGGPSPGPSVPAGPVSRQLGHGEHHKEDASAHSR